MDTKALRQKVLDLAIRGKLVPQNPNDEPASVLLERIRQQKQQMVKEGKLKAKDIKNDTIIFVGEDNLHYEKFADGSVKCIEDEIPFELPEGWAWARLTSICLKVTDGTHHSPDNFPIGAYKYITAKNIKLDGVALDEITYVTDEVHREIFSRCNPEYGDILYIKDGATSGIATVNTLREEFSMLSSVALLKPACGIDNWYMCYAMQSPYFYNTTRGDMKGVGITRITLNMLTSRLIPVPSQSEQQRISTNSRKLIELISNIESDKGCIIRFVSQAKSKILDLAIRGQLVPQDPNDEPASVLLERIRAEKEELIKQGKIKRDKKETVIFRGEDNSYYEKLGEKVSEYAVDELPGGWIVGSFSQVNMFASETIDPSNFPDEMFELYSVPNFEAGTPEIICGKEIGSSKQSICKNDVLLCKINPRINRVWITGHITPYRLLGSSEWIVFRNHLLFAPYLRYYFYSPYFRELMLSNVSGVGGSLMRAQPESVKKYPILIPPYQEQLRITERIDELFALLVAIEKSLT